MLGDFAGGGLVLAMGVACAVVERFSSGRGQVIDTAMVDGAAMILGHLELAEKTTISPGTMISKSIKTQGKTFTGIFPFFEKNDWIKVTMLIKRLLRKRD